jgi:hypothetical protein
MLTDKDGIMEERLNSLLNNSPTKQAYSFGKANRFKKYQKKDDSFKFYNIPEKKDMRATILGYGKKCNYNQNIGCGSNQLYAAPSYFDPSQHNAPVYSFGVSRPQKRKEEQSPGPKYNCRKNFGEGIPSYIFGKSGLKKYRKLQRSSSLPGPGSYYNENNHKLSESFSSNLMNSASIIIGHEKRFLNKYKDKTPGPGEYEMPGLITKTGMLYNSKYISIPARSFLCSRNNKYSRKKDISPGPGQYNSFSIFEGYTRAKVQKK